MRLQMIDLKELAPNLEHLFGGKACGLARLFSFGAAVPPGFAVSATFDGPSDWSKKTIETFFVRVDALLKDDSLTSAPHESSSQSTAQTNVLRDVSTADSQPRPRYLAVRSSAIGEDSGDRSFAGLFETVLGVTDGGSALEAAARCIASGGSERVRAYAGGETPKVGVVVQAQIDALAAGVCFTVDPAGEDRALLIEAVRGLGDQLVSGRAQPEGWRVYRTGLGTWDARRVRPADNATLEVDRETKRVRPADNATLEVDRGTKRVRPADDWVLEAGQAAGIASEAEAFATAAGGPLDLEWAIDRQGKLWWLQARPITAARPPLEVVVSPSFEGMDDGPVTVWANFNVRETMPDPFPPLTWSVWRDIILPEVLTNAFGLPDTSPIYPHVQALDLVHGRIYWNMNGLFAVPVVGKIMQVMLRPVDANTADTMKALQHEGVFRQRRIPGGLWRLGIGMVRSAFTTGVKILSAVSPGRTLRKLENCADRISSMPDVSTLSDVALLDNVRLIRMPLADPFKNGINAEVLAFLMFAVAERLFRDHPKARQMLAAGHAGPTTEISLAIDELILHAQPFKDCFEEVQETGVLLERLDDLPGGAAWVARFRSFLRRFGQRGPKEFDIGSVRWSDAPEMILELVRAGLNRPPGLSLAARMEALAEERHKAIEVALEAAPSWRRPLMRLAATSVLHYMPLREGPKHYAMFIFKRMRDATVEIGRRLAARGVIDAPEDVFFLEWKELNTLLAGSMPDPARQQTSETANLRTPAFDLDRRQAPEAVHQQMSDSDRRQIVAQRRALYQRFLMERPPDIVRSDGVPVPEQASGEASTDESTLVGVGVSGGNASGPVRVLLAPDPRAVQDGDVLVMEIADPGWTPLFPRASAVIMEVGGMMCHAAVVARELGIPAVFGVRDARSRLRDGQRVSVDGETGLVRFLDE